MTERAVRILLFRHGEVDSPPGIFYSQQDVLLSPAGEAQAATIARSLSGVGISRILSSDLSRCRFMASAIGETSGIPYETDPRLREVDFGEWSGWTWEEIESRYPGALSERMRDLEGFRPPGGESLGDLAARAWPVFEGIMKGPAGMTAAVVAHGGLNRVVLARMIGLPLACAFSLAQDYACMNVIDVYPDGGVSLRLLNRTFE